MTNGEIEMFRKLLITEKMLYINNLKIKHLVWLTLLILTFALLSSCAHMDSIITTSTQVVSKNCGVLIRHYEDLAKEANSRLQKNREALAEYEAHPYYYGREGQDLRSHASANIREYEKVLIKKMEKPIFRDLLYELTI